MSFTPSQNELAVVTQIFAKADPQKLGILTGDAALKVFGGAKLPPTVLGEIWSIADEDNNGWLPRKGVAIAVRLMGWAQKGEKITEALVSRRELCILSLRLAFIC
jgi:epidermal growth factor receptor substrate 15